MTDEQKAKISAALIGRPKSLVTRARISAATMGHTMSLTARAKDSAAHLGHKDSSETRAKKSAALMGNQYTLGYYPSVATRAKMSAARMGNTNSLGFHPSEETKIKISAASRGRIKSPETRARLSAANLGLKRTPETVAHMSAARMGLFVGSLNPNWKGGAQIWAHKASAKRRLLGFTPLNSWFEGCEGHHVDNDRVIYMPKPLHRSVYHNQHTGQGMAKINAVAYNFLFKQEVEAAMAAKEK